MYAQLKREKLNEAEAIMKYRSDSGKKRNKKEKKRQNGLIKC